MSAKLSNLNELNNIIAFFPKIKTLAALVAYRKLLPLSLINGNIAIV